MRWSVSPGTLPICIGPAAFAAHDLIRFGRNQHPADQQDRTVAVGTRLAPRPPAQIRTYGTTAPALGHEAKRVIRCDGRIGLTGQGLALLQGAGLTAARRMN